MNAASRCSWVNERMGVRCVEDEGHAGPHTYDRASSAATALERAVAANAKLVNLDLPAGAVQLLYDVLGHFPHDPGSWANVARAKCSIALMEARDV